MKAQRISWQAYQALRDALPAVVWNKRPFESLLRSSLRDHPELLAGLNFDDTKRNVADALIDRLAEKEGKYQQVTLRLMLELSSMKRFPNVEAIKDSEDRALRLHDAQVAVAHLAEMTKPYSELVQEQDRLRAEQEALYLQEQGRRRFDDELVALKARFHDLEMFQNPQQRGRDFESLLADLFKLFDMEPRLAYSTSTEQIDGSLNFDTDDYLLEAKWQAGAVDRAAFDVFVAKVHRKGKNALGLFVAVNGFTKPALDAHSESTPFIAMDGGDLYAVLDGRIRLDDLMRAKLRHANETGSCFLPASRFL
ncbi:restriction endonuclease [Nocardioides sp. NPDC126508]